MGAREGAGSRLREGERVAAVVEIDADEGGVVIQSKLPSSPSWHGGVSAPPACQFYGLVQMVKQSF